MGKASISLINSIFRPLASKRETRRI